jgi:hypothetical protein
MMIPIMQAAHPEAAVPTEPFMRWLIAEAAKARQAAA